jgi:ribose transport system substrate-binding protein
MRNWVLSILALVVVAGCGSGDSSNAPSTSPTTPGSDKPAGDKPAGGKKTIAFVTNNASDFWTIARKGTEKAQGELSNYTIEFQIPSDGSAAEQKRILDDLVAKGVAGIAVSPVDPKNQAKDLDALAGKVALFCQDSDAPDTQRACYVGTNNVAAGEMAGAEVKKALPNGGKIMVFVGKADAQNAKERYEGLKKALEGSNVTIVDLRTDDTDRMRAKQNVADTLVKNPDIAGLVGLWSYNGPAIANAVKEAGKAEKVKIVCFDEEAETLAAIKSGLIFSTIVQQPFEFGYQSMTLLAKYLDGDKAGIPADKKLIVPTQVVDKASVEAFETKLKELTK